MSIICDYCGEPAQLVDGSRIYPHRPDLYDRKFWFCRQCSAWVGCHKNGATPLGRLADAHLRAAKQRAHKSFDPLWKSGGMSRHRAYQWLADHLGISMEACHIGMFNEEQCEQVVNLVHKHTGSSYGRCST
ncbi:DUF3268 family zinc-finger domain-containing protein [Klebsiella pneumoniae]|nr:DUF3268 family zinc-finger domain-containing protein [Klebsiella pneumoniae]